MPSFGRRICILKGSQGSNILRNPAEIRNLLGFPMTEPE
jgi:hypothetical protein